MAVLQEEDKEIVWKWKWRVGNQEGQFLHLLDLKYMK